MPEKQAPSPVPGRQPQPEPAAATCTGCCIVGGGPAGMILGYLLARRGIAVTVLERQDSFERAFRGDTVHAATMEILADLGLAEKLLALPHTKIPRIAVKTPAGDLTLGNFDRLKGRFPYMTLMPQSAFLAFLADEARRYPWFHLIMGASVTDVLTGQGQVQGVHYETAAGVHDLYAELVVASDGRHSILRQLSGIPEVATSPPMDVLWFRLPRRAGDPTGAMGRAAHGHILALLDRGDAWQAAYVIPKGQYGALQNAGLSALKAEIADLAPEFADRLDSLHDWTEFAFLAVTADRLTRWYKPGLLFIGDAAHAMSPVGGVGINYAIQDAVVAANVLTEPLRRREVTVRHLRAIQRQREWPTRFIQRIQAMVQNNVIASALALRRPPRRLRWLRPLLSVPGVRDLPGRLIAYGIAPVRWTA